MYMYISFPDMEVYNLQPTPFSCTCTCVLCDWLWLDSAMPYLDRVSSTPGIMLLGYSDKVCPWGDANRYLHVQWVQLIYTDVCTLGIATVIECAVEQVHPHLGPWAVCTCTCTCSLVSLYVVDLAAVMWSVIVYTYVHSQ